MDQKPWWKNLQPLRLRPCWSIVWNKLESLEPDDLTEDDPAWQFTLVQDILYMRKQSGGQTVAIDLGWYPDGDPAGAYRLEAILDDNWENPILECTSRSTREIVETMEYWLFECLPCSQQVDEKSFRRRHPNRK
ncbi:MAG: hypothetical protein HFF61_02165 [Oscillospiraceae bacterium]|jgi:hypothetical protein|nr:hypothetical protein [Oscillospiraceae bacterium]